MSSLPSSEKPRLGVGMIGYAFMGRAHSQAWRNVALVFDVPLEPDLACICGRNAEAVAAAAGKLGWSSHETDWRRVIERDDIDLVDVSTPGDTHAEIAIAALNAGKHVLCEKPLANTIAEAEAMAEAAEKSGLRAMVGFNYRRVPAIELARRLIAKRRLGEIHHVRAVYLQDWIVDPEFPLVWRLRKELAGSGALGDIGAHIVDLSQHLVGDAIASVCGTTETFVRERPLPNGDGRGEVTVDDAALVLGRFSRGAIATFEASRFATGHKNGLRIEVNGSLGSLAFDLERLNELEICESGDGFRRVLVTEPDHPWLEAWWPPGHVLGWEHTFTNQARDLLVAIHEGVDCAPTFADGLQVQRVLDAVLRSSENGGWVDV
jgi:predicted dehydrogenase